MHPSPFPLGLYEYTCMSYCDVHLAPAIELYCFTLSVQIEETSWLVSLCPGMLLGDGLPVHYITPTSNICLFIAQIVRGDNWCVSGQQTFLCQLYETASIYRLKLLHSCIKSHVRWLCVMRVIIYVDKILLHILPTSLSMQPGFCLGSHPHNKWKVYIFA